jgi:hypothetical protein
MKKSLRTVRHWTLGACLLPTVWALGKADLLMLPAVGQEGWKAWSLYAAGVAVYALVEIIFAKPMWLYVFGHELTHALSGIMSGAKIHSFKANENGGEVRLSKSNVFVALSPYIVPLYAVFVIVVYALVNYWWPSIYLTRTFQFLLGFMMTFHLSLTYHAFHGRQTDLKMVGFFLSGVLVLFGNLLIMGVLGVSLFRRTPTFKEYARFIGQETVTVWKQGAHSAEKLWTQYRMRS